MKQKTVAALALALVALVPALSAASTSGTGYGAQVFGQSAGKWAHVDAHVPGSGPQTVDLTLAWENDPTPANFDLTVWEEGALEDGALTSDEAIAKAWTWKFEGPETLSVTLEGGGRYPMTIEPIQATGNTWTLTADGATLEAWGTVIVGTKLTIP